MPQYWRYDGLGLAARVAIGEIAPDDILDSALQLVAALNPQLNAVVRTMRAQAQRDIAAGLAGGPFKGVPIVLKDEYLSCAGVPCDHASALGAGFDDTPRAPVRFKTKT